MLKSIKTNRIIKAIEKIGFKATRQKGSHKFFEHEDGRTTLIPLHKEIRIKLLTKIIKQDLKMEKEEFLKLIEK
ncbi:MAG: type II toxin-antitoxin system HicA family toxin [Candidatus Diapherotrites archaeon]